MKPLLDAVGAAAAATVAALWMSTCAAAPELIWQGLKLFLDHLSWTAVGVAILMALVFVCFVEPVLRRLRSLLLHAPDEEPGHRPASILLWSALGLVFGFVSVCLHEAVAEFIAGHGSGAQEVIQLAVSFAAIPFMVTVAWQAAGNRILAIPLAILATISPLAAGWLFGWDAQAIFTTTVPGLAILFLGYRQSRLHPDSRLGSYALIVVLVAAMWLAVALLSDGILFAVTGKPAWLYDWADFFIDLRFYIGWALGLILAPASFGWSGRTAGSYQQV
ncbi:MAG: hypothetical protein J0H94_06675 [Rhizobiales bacterium]|nr:hypothetical protein [Hyphomicrobiales bacterium]